ncbi:MAG: hypothetical protein ACYCWE_03840 [Eubacteriales bacterium]
MNLFDNSKKKFSMWIIAVTFVLSILTGCVLGNNADGTDKNTEESVEFGNNTIESGIFDKTSSAEFYKGYLNGEYTIDTLLESPEVLSNAAVLINKVLDAYRSGNDPLELFTSLDISSVTAYPDMLEVRGDVKPDNLLALFRHTDGVQYPNKFTIPLSDGWNMDIHWDIGQFGDKYVLYGCKLNIYNFSQYMSQYLPGECTQLLFCHQIFGSQVYLCSYRTNPKSVCVNYTDNYGETLHYIDVTLPANKKFDTAEGVYATGGAGSGESQFWVQLTSGNEYEYIRYDNFAYSDESDWLAYSYSGEVSAEELIRAFGYDNAPVSFPNVNAPNTADSLDELSMLGLSDYLTRYIKAFVGGDTAVLEELSYATSGMYDEYKKIKVSRWVAYTGGGNEHEVHFSFYADSVGDTDGIVKGWNTLTLEVGMMGVSIADDDFYTDHNNAAKELRLMLNSMYYSSIPESDDMPDAYRWCLTEYICQKLGDFEWHTKDEVAAYAEKCFGIAGFAPDELHKYGEDKGYITLPHGGIHQSFRILPVDNPSSERDEFIFEVQFYADASKTVRSHKYRYTMMNVNGDWVYTGCEELYNSIYDVCRWSM